MILIKLGQSKDYKRHHLIQKQHQRCSVKENVLRNFTKFTGKHLCQSLFFNKVVGLRLSFFPFSLVSLLVTANKITVLLGSFVVAFGKSFGTPEGECDEMIQWEKETVAQRCSVKDVLRNFTKFTEDLWWLLLSCR